MSLSLHLSEDSATSRKNGRTFCAGVGHDSGTSCDVEGICVLLGSDLLLGVISSIPFSSLVRTFAQIWTPTTRSAPVYSPLRTQLSSTAGPQQ